MSEDLEDVKETVMQSMDDLLKRGESLDQLMQKSKDIMAWASSSPVMAPWFPLVASFWPVNNNLGSGA